MTRDINIYFIETYLYIKIRKSQTHTLVYLHTNTMPFQKGIPI